MAYDLAYLLPLDLGELVLAFFALLIFALLCHHLSLHLQVTAGNTAIAWKQVYLWTWCHILFFLPSRVNPTFSSHDPIPGFGHTLFDFVWWNAALGLSFTGWLIRNVPAGICAVASVVGTGYTNMPLQRPESLAANEQTGHSLRLATFEPHGQGAPGKDNASSSELEDEVVRLSDRIVRILASHEAEVEQLNEKLAEAQKSQWDLRQRNVVVEDDLARHKDYFDLVREARCVSELPTMVRRKFERLAKGARERGEKAATNTVTVNTVNNVSFEVVPAAAASPKDKVVDESTSEIVNKARLYDAMVHSHQACVTKEAHDNIVGALRQELDTGKQSKGSKSTIHQESAGALGDLEAQLQRAVAEKQAAYEAGFAKGREAGSAPVHGTKEEITADMQRRYPGLMSYANQQYKNVVVRLQQQTTLAQDSSRRADELQAIVDSKASNAAPQHTAQNEALMSRVSALLEENGDLQRRLENETRLTSQLQSSLFHEKGLSQELQTAFNKVGAEVSRLQDQVSTGESSKGGLEAKIRAAESEKLIAEQTKQAQNQLISRMQESLDNAKDLQSSLDTATQRATDAEAHASQETARANTITMQKDEQERKHLAFISCDAHALLRYDIDRWQRQHELPQDLMTFYAAYRDLNSCCSSMVWWIQDFVDHVMVPRGLLDPRGQQPPRFRSFEPPPQPPQPAQPPQASGDEQPESSNVVALQHQQRRQQEQQQQQQQQQQQDNTSIGSSSGAGPGPATAAFYEQSGSRGKKRGAAEAPMTGSHPSSRENI